MNAGLPVGATRAVWPSGKLNLADEMSHPDVFNGEPNTKEDERTRRVARPNISK